MSDASCVFCGGPALPVLETVDLNREAGDERFAYARCGDCGSLSLIDVPPDLGRFYPDSYNPCLPVEELEVAADGERHRLTFVRDHVERGRLVEVGPGNGAFAYAAARAGFDVAVIDRDERACESLAATAGIQAVRNDDPAAALAGMAPSDAIVMWHSIEHLDDPAGTLDAAAANLAPGGALAIATPNPDSLQLRVFGSRWVHLDAPRHLCLIPLSALDGRLGGAGLRQAAVTTTDPTSRAIARAGWGRVVPGRPIVRIGARPPSVAGRTAVRAGVLAMRAFEACMRPLESRGFRGAAYMALFVKEGAHRDRLR